MVADNGFVQQCSHSIGVDDIYSLGCMCLKMYRTSTSVVLGNHKLYWPARLFFILAMSDTYQ